MSMQGIDVLALGLVVVGASAFALAAASLGASSDLHALYWLAVAGVSLRATSCLSGGAPV
jgi:hypothetical protein